jgi:predicted ATPase
VPQRFAALAGLWRFYLNRAQLRRAQDLANQCFILAQPSHDPALLQEAHMMLGSSLFYLGAWDAGHRHLEESIALYDREQWRTLAVRSGLNPGVVSLARSAWTLWMLGYPDQALSRGQRALALAQEISHAYSTGFALHYLAIVHQGRREVQDVHAWAEATITLGREQRFVQWIAAGMCMQGWAQAEQGAVDAGIAQLREGITTWLDMGTELARTHMLFRLAEACWRGGYVEAGLQALDEALVVSNNTSERYYEAEVYRLKGELLMARQVLPGISSVPEPSLNEAETCLLQALDIARQQGAKSLQLRAVMSLCRLWQRQQHRCAEGRDLLAEIYAWFSEGLETQDLQEARALLERLK